MVEVTNTFNMEGPELEAQLHVGGDIYDETTTGFADIAAQDRGLFERQAGQIEFHPLFDPLTSGTYPVRLIINGAESQPFWIEIP